MLRTKQYTRPGRTSWHSMPALSSTCLINLVRSPSSDSASKKPFGLVIPWLRPSYREPTILSAKLQYKSSIPLPGSTEKAGRENRTGGVFKLDEKSQIEANFNRAVWACLCVVCTWLRAGCRLCTQGAGWGVGWGIRSSQSVRATYEPISK